MEEPVFDRGTAERLRRYLVKLSEMSPTLRGVLDDVQRGDIDEETAMRQMMQVLQEDPQLLRDLESQTELIMSVPGERALWQPSGDKPEMLFRGKTGLPSLNPLYEAALIERAQFDGDIPELRTGPLPEGVKASVQIETKCRTPAALGRMLEEASAQVTELVQNHQKQRTEAIASGETLEIVGRHGDLVRRAGRDISQTPDLAAEVWGSPATDLEVYKRGEVPKPVKVQTPSGTALLSMTPAERRKNAFHFMSTTQGRRTAIATIRELIAQDLRSYGLAVNEREFNPKSTEEPIAAHEWKLVLSGPGATQDSFSVIDVAARALSTSIKRKMTGLQVRDVHLEVISVDSVDVRTVGWAARVLAQEAVQ